MIEFYNWNTNPDRAISFLDWQLSVSPPMSDLNVTEGDYQIRACILNTIGKFVKKKEV